ncbi:MAG: hypothetical protein K0U78_15885 [Actinomycetia bacterium]|nr:hypothetical protein [Actinomycetes bacterium]
MRYNFKPFSVNLDWLTFNMDGPPRLFELTEPAQFSTDCWVIPTDKRSAVMSSIAYVVDETERKVLTLAGKPHNHTVRGPGWCQVQFANETLYTGEWVRLYRYLRIAGFSYAGVSKVDIAVDAVESVGGDFLGPIRDTWEGEARYNGKATWQPRIERNNIAAAVIGSGKGNKFLRVYDKTRELKSSGKLYILEKWQSVGVDPYELGERVMRCELSTKGVELRRYFPDCDSPEWPENLVDPSRAAEVMQSMCKSLFDFTTTEARSEFREHLVGWDWSFITSVDPDVKPRAERSFTLPINTVKSTVRTLTLCSLHTGDHLMSEEAGKLVRAAGLQQWYDRSLVKWRAELVKIEKANDPDTFALFNQLKLNV